VDWRNKLDSHMPSVSAVLITYNEAHDLPQVLDSLHGLVDEIVVVDSGSTDNTREIARQRGASVFLRHFSNFADQKNFAADQASNDWVLSVDADEVVNEDLRLSLLAWKATAPDCIAYAVRRQTYYLGKWIHHSGWYPRFQLRLYRRKYARFQGALHEGLHADGPTGRISGNLLHYTVRSLREHYAKVEAFTTLAAEDLYALGRHRWRAAMYLAGPWTFVSTLVFRLGFLDGYQGLLISWTAGRYVWTKYRKLGELVRGGRLERRQWPQPGCK
jgi:glycosyltransferase involved in cell wall biosynthesis